MLGEGEGGVVRVCGCRDEGFEVVELLDVEVGGVGERAGEEDADGDGGYGDEGAPGEGGGGVDGGEEGGGFGEELRARGGGEGAGIVGGGEAEAGGMQRVAGESKGRHGVVGCGGKSACATGDMMDE